MTLSLRYTARCEIGLVRKNNQDSCYVSPTMLIVADGMGGAAAGDLASAVVVRELRASDGPFPVEEMAQVLSDAVGRATAAIAELVETDTALDGMGSTVTGVMFDQGRAVVVNIGDSRTYLYRSGVLTRLTHDHSWVQSLVDEGRISEEESLIHPHRSLILRVINGQPQHTPDLDLVELQAGDRLLVCSDGLCGFVTDAAIAPSMDGELDVVLERLTGLAHGQGGLDNISIVLADVVEGPPEGQPQVYGAAALLDLDTPLDTMTIPLVAIADLATDDTVFAPQPPVQALPEQVRYAPTTRHSAGTWIKVLLTLFVPLVVVATGGWAWYQFTQQQFYVGANGEKAALYRGVPGDAFGMPLSSVVNPAGPTIADLPTHWQEVVRGNQTVTSREQGETMLTNLQDQADKCVQARANANRPVVPTPDPTLDPFGTATPGTPGVPGTPDAQTPLTPQTPGTPTFTVPVQSPPTGTPGAFPDLTGECG